MNELRAEYNLKLTEEEALGLLDIVMLAPHEISAEQRAAAEKLSAFCKELMKVRSSSEEPLELQLAGAQSPACVS